MNIDQVFKLFQEAKARSGHSDYIVIGSNSIIALAGSALALPEEMTRSIDFDAYPKDDPGRAFDLVKELGENSPFHEREGIYLDAVSPSLPTLPDGWKDRLALAEKHGIRLWCLDPNDAAVSKYARGEPRDLRWIRAGIRAGIVSLHMIRSRLAKTHFAGDDEQRRARSNFETDLATLGSKRG